MAKCICSGRLRNGNGHDPKCPQYAVVEKQIAAKRKKIKADAEKKGKR